jgi:hypothetical protein
MADFNRGGATDDSLGPGRSQPPVDVGGVVALVNNLIEAMYAAGDEAEAAYQAALKALRPVADEAAIALARLESDCDRRSYPRRWALIYAATQLERDSLLPFLRQVVLTPIPPEQSHNPHSYSTVKEETVLRATAVDGVGALAARGSEHARDSLFEFLAIDSISIRQASIRSLLAIDETMRDRIAEYLPRDARYLLDVRPVAVTEVPQIKNPRRHLRKGRSHEKPTPPDPEERAGPVREASPRTRG